MRYTKTLPLNSLLFILCILPLFLPALIANASAAAVISIVADSVPAVWTDATPYISADGCTMVPLRAAANVMDMDIAYDAAANAVTIMKAYANTAECPKRYQNGTSYATGVRIEFPIGQPVCHITTENFAYEKTVVMDTVATTLDGCFYVPIQYLAEPAGYTVEWDGETQTVILTSAARSRYTSLDSPLIVYDNDITELSRYFFGAFNANLSSFFVLFPQRNSFDGIVDFTSKGFLKFYYDYPEYANYTNAPTLRAKVTKDGLLCEFLITERKNGYARRDEAFMAGARFLSDLYENGKLTATMNEYDRARIIYDAVRNAVQYLDSGDKMDLTAWSSFERGNGVCMSFTAAYNMLLKLDGAKGVRGQAGSVQGISHIWTVAILNGTEYQIDATMKRKDYFGLTAAEMAEDHVFGEDYHA